METLIYIAKGCGILAIFYTVYVLFLAKETFYGNNRRFLNLGVLSAFVLPFLVFKKEVYLTLNAQDLVNSTTSLQTLETAGLTTADYLEIVLLSVYFLGVSVMIIRLLLQTVKIFSFLKNQEHFTKNGIKYLEIAGILAPFSFFGYVVYDPSQHTDQELNMILAHEAAHAKSGHTWDILLSKLLLVTQWFNPFAWLYAKKMEQNLEYMADASATQQTENKKGYQLAMLRTGISNQVPALSSSFYNSLIKKRVIMLNKQSSSQTSKFKLAIIVPLLAMFLYSFNYKENVKLKIVSSDEAPKELETLSFSYKSTDAELEAIEEYFKNNVPSVDVKIDHWRDNSGNISRCFLSTRFEGSEEFVKNLTIEPEDIKSLKFNYLIGEEDGSVVLYFVDDPSTSKFVISKGGAIAVYTNYQVEEKITENSGNLQNKTLSTVTSQEGEAFTITIPMSATKKELDKIVKDAEATYDIKLDLSGIKRNKKGNIIALQVDYKSKNDIGARYIMSDDNGLNDIIFYRTESGEVGFANHGTTMAEIEREKQKRDEEIEKHKAEIKERKKETQIRIKERQKQVEERQKLAEERQKEVQERALVEISAHKERQYLDSINASNQPNNILIRNAQEDKVLYVLDGEVIDENEMNSLDVSKIKSIQILKDKSAIEKYGKKAEDGVVKINTKDDTPPSNIEVRSIDSNAVLYILDGEESTKATVDRLDPKTIESVSVLKNESATSLYGDKGKNGVIIVTTKVK